MQGVLVVDKPQGLTSHDVVAVARRALGESRIGHTGTLDPLATGVLPLAVDRATRLIRFLTASDKDYSATIRFGFTTNSYDVTGAETSRTDRVPSRDEVVAGIESLTGEYLQEPPAFSAKKVAGRRAYDLARKSEAVVLQPVPVRVTRAALIDYENGTARVDLTSSAGFYVRAFAHSLGQFTRTGACLEALKRTRSGAFTLNLALSLASLSDPSRVEASLVPLDALLPDVPSVSLNERGRMYVTHGREIGPDDYTEGNPSSEWVRLIDLSGALVALGNPGRAPGSLHPSVVLI
ncbi:MAG: tRNA pseudouridine(55) synthase TruB [Acidobacteria bacterium]|nr:tRNA pseudouridine(55) synthase TruB [Acidobacteriota bacterium]